MKILVYSKFGTINSKPGANIMRISDIFVRVLTKYVLVRQKGNIVT